MQNFLARLVGLVPPPRQHQVRYFGVFSNHHALRPQIRIAPGSPTAAEPTQVPLSDPTRIGWAELLARVFAIDVTFCRRCGGALRIVAAVTDADELARVFHGARPPPRPSLPGQLGFFDP